MPSTLEEPKETFFFWPCIFNDGERIKPTKCTKLIFGLIYYCSIPPTCFGPLVEAIIREFKILKSYKAIVVIC